MIMPELPGPEQGPEQLPEDKSSTVITSQTSTVTKSDDPAKLLSGESTMLGISIRAWLTTLIVATVCYLSILGKEIFEPLYGGFLLTLGFFFGQATQKKQ